MRTETEYTGEFMVYVKENLSCEHLVLKHSDRFTKGIPDLTVSSPRNRTVWIESKRLDRVKDNVRNPLSWISKNEEMQMYNTARLGGHYLLFDPQHSTWAFISGRTAAFHYRQKSIIQDRHLLEDDFLLVGDRFALYQKVVNYLTKEL